jgi:hypothetical protein
LQQLRFAIKAVTKAHDPKKGFLFEVVGWLVRRYRLPPARRRKASGSYDNAIPALSPSLPNQIQLHAAGSSLGFFRIGFRVFSGGLPRGAFF